MAIREKPAGYVVRDPRPTQDLSYMHDVAERKVSYELTPEDAVHMSYAGRLTMEEVVQDLQSDFAPTTTEQDQPTQELKTRYIASVTPLAKRAVQTLTSEAI